MKAHIAVLAIIFYFIVILSLNSVSAQNLYNIDSLRSIHITFYNPDYDSLLQSWWLPDTGERLPASIQMNGIKYDSAGVRYKGNFTFWIQQQANNPKFPLNIDMNYYVSGQKLMGYKKLKLSNCADDPTFIREVLAGIFYRKHMPASEICFVKVYINSNYMGVYANAESINKQFLTKHFDYKKGVLFKCDPPETRYGHSPKGMPNLFYLPGDSSVYYDSYILKSDYGWEQLAELIDVLNNRPEEIETILNVDRVLWHFAVSTVATNYDTYNGFYVHNYYLYKHKDGLFHIIPWDLNESFGGAMGTKMGGEIGMEQWPHLYGYYPYKANRPLVNKLLANETYRKQYIAHIRTLITEVMDTANLANTIDYLQSMIYDAVQADRYKHFDTTMFYSNLRTTLYETATGLKATFVRLLPTIENRRKLMLNLPEFSALPPVIQDVERNIANPGHGDEVWIKCKVLQSNFVELMVTKNKYDSFFRPIQMYDDGLHYDDKADDGVYCTQIPYSKGGDEVKYYIRAQNDMAMMLSPENAEYEFYSYNIDGPTDITAKMIQKEITPHPNPFSESTTINYELSNPGRVVLNV